MSFLSRLTNAVTMAVPLTAMGLVGIPVIVLSSFSGYESRGTSGLLGFAFSGLFVIVSSLVGSGAAVLAMLLGFPWFVGFLVGYFITMMGLIFSMSA
jgi:hypothetical protein